MLGRRFTRTATWTGAHTEGERLAGVRWDKCRREVRHGSAGSNYEWSIRLARLMIIELDKLFKAEARSEKYYSKETHSCLGQHVVFITLALDLACDAFLYPPDTFKFGRSHLRSTTLTWVESVERSPYNADSDRLPLSGSSSRV
jgi:hypothetical protein